VSAPISGATDPDNGKYRPITLFAYDAFGNPLQRNRVLSGATVSYSISPAGNLSAGMRYRGMWFDGGEAGLYKTETRSYDPGLGRFTQLDPAQAGANWYAYCGGDPINRVDPAGLRWRHIDGEWKWVPDEGEEDTAPAWQPKPDENALALDEYLALEHVDLSFTKRVYLSPEEARLMAEIAYGSSETPESWMAARTKASTERFLASDREKDAADLARFASDPSALAVDVWRVNAKRAKLKLFYLKSATLQGYAKTVGPVSELLMLSESIPLLLGGGVSAAIRNEVTANLGTLLRGGSSLTAKQQEALGQYFSRFAQFRKELSEIGVPGTRAFNLAFDPAIGAARAGEARAALEFELHFGSQVVRSAHGGIDYIVTQGKFAGKSLDFVGAEVTSQFFKMAGKRGFAASITKHLGSSDYTVLFLRRLTATQIAEVEAFVDTLSEAQRALLIIMK
jgi:RHS repeat-associated protein